MMSPRLVAVSIYVCAGCVRLQGAVLKGPITNTGGNSLADYVSGATQLHSSKAYIKSMDDRKVEEVLQLIYSVEARVYALEAWICGLSTTVLPPPVLQW